MPDAARRPIDEARGHWAVIVPVVSPPHSRIERRSRAAGSATVTLTPIHRRGDREQESNRRRRRRGRALAAAACSSSAKTRPRTSRPRDRRRRPTHAARPRRTPRPACTPKASAPVVATRVAGSTSDYDVTSFDGTKIRVALVPAAAAPPGTTAPTVLKGPGWGQPGDTNTAGSGYGLFGDLSIHTLQTAGYNVLTWDPRGFGAVGRDGRDRQPRLRGPRRRATHRLGRRSNPACSSTRPDDPRDGHGRRVVRRRHPARHRRRSTAGSTRSCPRSRGTRSARASTRRRPSKHGLGRPPLQRGRRATRSTRTSRARTPTSDATGVISAGRQAVVPRPRARATS